MTSSVASQQVVFIDSNVPDLQDLLNGLAPGVEAFVLDPSSDGLAQIAAILAANGLTDLSSISIVGHGAAGQIQVGSTTLDAGDLSSDSDALAQIGAALAPGGAFQLYACDTASGLAGQQFIAELSQYAGGATVAASTQDVGTLQGTNGLFENWTLDASTGAGDASVPFTAAALDSYQGLLAAPTVTVSAITTTLTIDADGDKGVSPGDTVTSSIKISDSGGNATGVVLSETPSGLTAVANSVLITPIAVNDSYTATGNTTLTVTAANGVLANDIEFNGGTLSAVNIIQSDATTHGTVTLNSNGGFTYTPDVGFSGTATFQYTANDAAGNSDQTGTATITVGAPTWYVSNAGNDTTGNGTEANPFATIEKAVGVAGTNSTIMVEAGSYSGAGITLASGEKLIGAGSGSTTFTVSSGNAVTLNSGNTISGITIKDTGTGDGIVNGSGGIGTLTLSDIGVNTTSGTGISLVYSTNTASNIVDITGTGNTISSTSGTALDITNTNIGSSGATFQSISSGAGTAAGIILDNTGTSGSLTVTGDGGSASGGDSTGGTIANKTGALDLSGTDGVSETLSGTNGVGIVLENTLDPSFNNMTLQNFSNFAVYGSDVTGFNLTDSTVDTTTGLNGQSGAGGSEEGSIRFDNLFGNAAITGSTISDGYDDNVNIQDGENGVTTGTLNLDMSGDTLGFVGNNSSILLTAWNGTTFNATATGNTFLGTKADFFSFAGQNSSTTNAIVSGNTFEFGETPISGGSDPITVTGDQGTWDITNNIIDSSAAGTTTGVGTANGYQEQAIFVDATDGSGTVNTTIEGNQIGPAFAGSANQQSNALGIGAQVVFGETLNALIENNTLTGYSANEGINLLATQGTNTLNAELYGNTESNPDGSSNSFGTNNFGLAVTGAGTGGQASTINLVVGSATVPSEKNTFVGATLPIAFSNLGSNDTIQLSENGGGSSSIQSVLNNDNKGNAAWTSGGIKNPTLVTSLPTTPPAVPTLLTSGFSITGTSEEGASLTASQTATDYQWQEAFSGSGYVDIAGATSQSFTPTEAQVGATLRVVETEVFSDGTEDSATSAATSTVADGLTLTTPTISTTSVPGQSTTNPVPGQVLTASTPTSDNSDATITYQWQANGTNISGATGQSFTVTSAQLGDTIRVVATATDPHGGDVSAISAATTVVDAFVAQSLSDVSIGTLPGGDAVTVSWQATVNPQSDQLIVNPTYTGTVGNESSNFAQIAADATVPLDTLTLSGEIFNDANGNGTLDGGEVGISGVSLSVFVQGSSTALESTTTNGSGVYDFTGLAAGNYYVQINALPSGYGNSSPVRDTTPNDYAGDKNYGLAVSGGVIDTNAITIAYNAPEPTGATTYPGDDTTSTLDIGLTQNPVIGGTGNTAQYYQGGAAKPLDSNLTLTDSVNVSGATVTIGNFLTGDALNFTLQNGISEQSYSGGVLTLTGNATAAQYQTALDSITYSFSGDPTDQGTDKTRTITWSVSDTNSQTSVGGSTSTIDVFAQPIVSIGAAGTPTETSTSGPVIADSTLSITDYNGTTIHDASVQITSGDVVSDTLTINGTTSGTINDGVSGTISYSFAGATLTLTGTDTVADYDAALDKVKFNAVSPNSGTRTLTWQVNDEAGGNTNDSVPVTTNVDVTFGPQVTAGATATFDGGSATPVMLDSGLIITDAQSTTLGSAAVTIGPGFIAGDTLTINGLTSGSIDDGASGTITYSFSGSTLSLTGTDTVTDYQSALELVQYNFTPTNGDPTSGGGDLSRTISWTASDSTSTSSPATSTLDVVHVAPTVTAGGTVTFTGGSGTRVTLDGTVAVADVDSAGNLAGATVSIGSFLNGDTLNFATQNGITGAYDAATGVLTLAGTASLTNYQTALDSITYSFSPSDGDPTSKGNDTARTISWTVTDGSTSNGTSNAGTSTLDTVHVAPTLLSGGTVTFTGGGSAVTLDSTLTVSDVDSGANLAGATVSVSSGFLSGDTLNFTNQAGITGSYDAAHGILTLTGTATIAQYQAALESVTYSVSPSDGDPTGGGSDTARTISWTVSDGSTSNGTSNVGTSTLDTVHVAPIVTSGGTVTFNGGGGPVTLDSGLTVSDVDSAGDLTGATVQIGTGFLSGDTLNFTNQAGITGSYDAAHGILTLSGTSSIANYQTALDSVTYSFSPSNGDPTNGETDTSRTISWSVTDGNTNNGTSNTSTSTLDTTHTPPTVIAGASATFDGGGSPVTLDGTLTVTDPDSNGNLSSAFVGINSGFVSGDMLNFTNQNGITGSYDAVHGILTLTGTSSVFNYQTALDSVTYSFSPSNGDPTNGGGATSRTFTWTADDGESSATGGSTLTVVHVAPTVTAGAAATFDGGGSPVTLDGALTVADVDSGGNLSSAVVTVSSGFIFGDTLNFTNQNGITGSYDATIGFLTLTGTSSVANYQTALDSITYSFTPSDGDPTGGGDTARVVSWTVTDGSTSNGDSNTATSTLETVHVAPTVTAGATATFELSGPAVTADGTLTLTDPDSGGDLTGATVSISLGFQTGNDVLQFTNQNGITGSFNSVTGVLTLFGTATAADYQTALDSVTFNSTIASSGNRTLSWTVDDDATSHNTSNTATSTIYLVIGPQLTAGATATFNGGGSPVTLDGTLSVSDPVHPDLDSATVSISSNFLSGDVLNFTNQSGITGSYDAVHGVLTLTGTSSVANYQTALDSITYSFSPSNGDPTSGGGDTSRTISWSANDGTANSTAVTSTLDVVHEAPTVTAAATATFELAGPAVTADGALTVTDPDSGGTLTSGAVTIASGFAAGDSLSFTNNGTTEGNISVGSNAGGQLVLTSPGGTATLAQWDAALESITFDSTVGAPGQRTIVWTVSDGAASSNTATSTIDLVVGPQITAGATATFNGGGSPVTLDGTLTVTDPAHANLTGAMVVITSNFLSGDVLNFTNQNGITGSYDPVNGILTLTGMSSVANYQTALDSVTYGFSPSNGDPTGGGDTSRTITWVASDSIATSAAATSTLDTVHVAPTVTAGGTATFYGGGSAVTLDGALTVSAPDSGGNLTGGTVSIGTGFTAGDILSFINQNNITGSYNAVNGMLTLSGTDTAADYQAALDSVTYSFSPAGGDATKGGTDTSRAITWQVNDGSSSNGTGTAASTLLVPTTPVVTAAHAVVPASASESFTAAQLFSASDPAGAPILTYEVEDESSGSSQGFWVLNGAVLPNGQITTLTAAQLSELSFVAGSASTPVSDTLEVAASDAAGLGAFTTFTVTAAAHAPTTAPTVTAANELQAPNQALAGSSLFSGTAFGGNTITSYEVEDTTTDSGHWVFNGTVEPTNQLIDVTVAQLAQLSFDTGYGSDNLMVRANDGTQWGSFTSFTVTPPPNAAPPAGTADTLVMLRNADGAFEFYDIGRNTILLDGPLGQINPALQVAGVGGFNGADTADLLMRDPTTGVFTLYDVSNDNITGNVVVGQVGLEWTVSGLGDFSTRANETDMLMRNSNTGQFEVYDIASNAITFAGPMGQVGLEWSIAGFGDFSTRADETDMLMRNSNTGAFEVYDIANNAITFAGPMGQVGLEWSIAGFGDFSTRANETDMLMRNSNTGAFEVFDIANNTITFAGPMGQVGLEWTIAGFGDFSGNANETDMLMRNSNTGVFELYDINNNTITSMTGMGQVGLEWSISGVSAAPASAPPTTQLSGIAADPADAAPSSATAQLTQAMASFAPSAGAAATSSPLGQSSPVAETPNLFAAASQTPSAMA